jgi:23S rRNA (cytidine1920-2'-O)/16S rRNA (cytidine1409-2'-O)-methyltransferase
VGASTGGFTDCLLQAGAARVIALDVGYGQLDSRLRSHERVVVLERLNARYLTCDQLPFAPDIITADVSFISLHKVLPALVACAADRFRALVLVKPQFEAGPERVGKRGIVRDPRVHRDVLLALAGFVTDGLGLQVWGVTDSGLLGAGGNREFFLLFGRGGEAGLTPATLEPAVDRLIPRGDQDE